MFLTSTHRLSILIALTPPVAELNDTVVFHFVDEPNQKRTLKLVFGDADISAGSISVHSPVGEALVGAAKGEDVEIFSPQGERSAIIDEIQKPGTPAVEPAIDIMHVPSDAQAAQVGANEITDPAGIRLSQPASATSDNVNQYVAWVSIPLPDPRETGTANVAGHLKAIIAAEGPIRVQRAYRLYAQACGINRVCRMVRSSLNQALHYLVRKEEVELAKEGPDDAQTSAIARLKGEPPVMVRSAGGRDFWDVPPSEIAALMRSEKSSLALDDDELYHRILHRYDISRLTSKIHAECNRIHSKFVETDGIDTLVTDE